MTTPDKALTITVEARNSISSFCFEECHAYCCRKGYLPLNGKELKAVTKGNLPESKEQVKKMGEDKYSLYMGQSDKPCPSLSEWKCSIYKDNNRPKVCAEYPIFLDQKKKEVKLSPRCLAVREGKFYGYEAEMLALGYKIAKPHPYSEFEFTNVE